MKRAGGIFSIILWSFGLCPAAFAGPPSPSYPRPAYQTLAYDEDWSVLGHDDPDRPDDFFDPIKYIKLNDSGSIWLSFGGQVRWRLEGWNDFNFGAPPSAVDSDVFVLNRLLYHVDLHLGEHVRGFLQGKSAFCMDRDLIGGCRTLDVDELALQNGFIDVMLPLPGDTEVTVRTGRQELLFGKQRLVSPLDWANIRRTFDGVAAIFRKDKWKVTGFLTRPVQVRKYDYNNNFHNREFYGVYASGKVPTTDIGLDLYWLALQRKKAAFNGTTGREDRHTLGGRIWGKFGDSSFDYDLEGAYQFGEIGSASIDAFMIATEIGYLFKEASWKPRVFVAYDYASGDSNSGGSVQTFNQLFPLGHAYFGYIDTVARQNISSPKAGVIFKPFDKTLVKLEGMYFWRADRDDALYNAGGGVVRPGFPGSSHNVGAEIDLTLKYKFDRHLVAVGGYSHFFTDNFIKQTGPRNAVDFLYLTLQYTF